MTGPLCCSVVFATTSLRQSGIAAAESRVELDVHHMKDDTCLLSFLHHRWGFKLTLPLTKGPVNPLIEFLRNFNHLLHNNSSTCRSFSTTLWPLDVPGWDIPSRWDKSTLMEEQQLVWLVWSSCSETVVYRRLRESAMFCFLADLTHISAPVFSFRWCGGGAD